MLRTAQLIEEAVVVVQDVREARIVEAVAAVQAS
jgi:hypothetical protein